jgi:hypothetical protein
MAVEHLSHHVSTSAAESAVVQLLAELAALYRGVTPAAVEMSEGTWSDGVVDAAGRSHDAHQVKLVLACRRGADVTGDPAFVRAAQVVTQVGGRDGR